MRWAHRAIVIGWSGFAHLCTLDALRPLLILKESFKGLDLVRG